MDVYGLVIGTPPRAPRTFVHSKPHLTSSRTPGSFEETTQRPDIGGPCSSFNKAPFNIVQPGPAPLLFRVACGGEKEKKGRSTCRDRLWSGVPTMSLRCTDPNTALCHAFREQGELSPRTTGRVVCLDMFHGLCCRVRSYELSIIIVSPL